jgi:hypothetical protein
VPCHLATPQYRLAPIIPERHFAVRNKLRRNPCGPERAILPFGVCDGLLHSCQPSLWLSGLPLVPVCSLQRCSATISWCPAHVVAPIEAVSFVGCGIVKTDLGEEPGAGSQHTSVPGTARRDIRILRVSNSRVGDGLSSRVGRLEAGSYDQVVETHATGLLPDLDVAVASLHSSLHPSRRERASGTRMVYSSSTSGTALVPMTPSEPAPSPARILNDQQPRPIASEVAPWWVLPPGCGLAVFHRCFGLRPGRGSLSGVMDQGYSPLSANTLD